MPMLLLHASLSTCRLVSEKSGVPNFAMSPTFVGHLHKMLDCLRKVLFRPIWENILAHL